MRQVSIHGFRVNYDSVDADGVTHLERELDKEKATALFLEAKKSGNAFFEDDHKKYVLTHHEKRGLLTNQDEYTLFERDTDEGTFGVLGL